MRGSGQRVRIVEPESAFFGKEGRVARSSPPGTLDPAHAVVLDDADGAVPPMTFYPHEVEEIEERGERG